MAEAQDYRDRPKLNARQQVEFLRDKGVAFSLCHEEEAERFLRDGNYFFKLKAFEKAFDKYENPSHPRFGQYVDLDFAYLVELSRLDKALRFCIMETALDIEHFMKVRMNRAMMDDESCDAYGVIEEYFAHDAQSKLSRLAGNKKNKELHELLVELCTSLHGSACRLAQEASAADDSLVATLDAVADLDAARDAIESELDGIDLHHIEKSISRLYASQYSGRLARKYGRPGKMAYWHFFELATFGDVIGLYKYYFIERCGAKDAVTKGAKPLLFPTRTLRNAAAHNSCLLNTSRDKLRKPVGAIAKALTTEYGMDQELVSLTKRVPLVHDFSALLLCYDLMVSSPHSRDVCSRRLRTLAVRIRRHSAYFSKQSEVMHCLGMLVRLCERFADRFSGSLL